MGSAYRQKVFLTGLVGAVAVALVVSCNMTIPRQRWHKKWGPLVPHRTFPGDCGICHLTDGWDTLREDFSFDHEKETGRSLEGAHDGAACLRCHNDRGPVTDYLVRGCGGCHPDPHASALGLDCQSCHGQIDWRPTGLIAEHATTRFHLVAAHAVVPCESCHPKAAIGQFRLPSEKSRKRQYPRPRSERLDNQLRAMPYCRGLDGWKLRAPLLPAHWRARGPALHELPHRRRLSTDPFGLLFLPLRRLSARARSRDYGLPA
ncbi:MAG: hypothetical protein ACYSWW_04395 [Planctomycetota bacterium]|jgi:hypothetical protein